MATQASDVIRATTEILRSGRETEQFRVQTALTMLGMAQQIRIQDIEIAGKQLGMLESTNIQQMQSQARTFLTVTGFNQWYNPEKEDWAETMIDDLTDAPKIKKGVNVGGYGFSETDAHRIAGAVQSFYLQSPEGILEIADELADKVTAGTEDSLVRGFKSVGVFSPDRKEKFHQQLAGISQTLENREMIVAEKYEYGRGEFEIQRDIRQVEKVEFPTPVDPLEPEVTEGVELTEMQQLGADIKDKEKAKNLILIEMEQLAEMKKAGMLNEEQERRLAAIPGAVQEYDKQMKDLSSKIESSKSSFAISAAREAKGTLLELGERDWAEDYQIKELSDMLKKYDPKVSEYVSKGRPGMVAIEAFTYGGALSEAPMTEKIELFALSKKIQESQAAHGLSEAVSDMFGLE
jgi:hypothetical protein